MDTLSNDVRDIVTKGDFDADISRQHLARLEDSFLTRDENPQSHFCAYFAPFDSEEKKVFLGHHIKSGLWLFNGGHIDANEGVRQAVEREMDEEWGFQAVFDPEPFLITVTDITQNSSKRPCRKHFDIWFKVPLSQSHAHFDTAKLATEFHETRWVQINEAETLVVDPSTLRALDALSRV